MRPREFLLQLCAMVSDKAWNSSAERKEWNHTMPTVQVESMLAPIRTPADIYASAAEQVHSADIEPREPEGSTAAELGDGVFRKFQRSYGLYPQCPSGFEV